jgi:FMN phosphatase YigB (HAD superfamily)
MGNLRACRAVVFDAYGTLFDVAADFGFAAVWLDRRGDIPERLPGRFSARIASLAELPALLTAA